MSQKFPFSKFSFVKIAERITQYGGIGLLIDYGHDGQRSTLSLRAYKNHQLVNPLKNPGKQDITADIDFGYLRSLIEEQTVVFGPIKQK